MITTKLNYTENIQYTIEYLKYNCEKSEMINSDNKWKDFKEKTGQYVYLILWEENCGVFSWGTTSGSSDRITKIFNIQ